MFFERIGVEMDYSKIMQFKGKWRNYQERVLNNSSRYLADGRVHIVAAPGSGKTTLGIELIARLGQPALVLAPSITIREQWVARIIQGFLKEGVCSENYISQDLKEPRAITVVTYQALHSAMIRYKGKEKAEGEETNTDENTADGQEVDYSGFDVVQTMRDCRVGTLCLDECHHLRAEWWKALEEFKSAIGNVKVIALTATPPYDSTPAFWKRYMDMCGEIDEEITIPELVKEGSLCPHQDYVYFNYPTEEETGEIEAFTKRSRFMYEGLLKDEAFKNAVATHRSLQNEDEAFEKLLSDAKYMNAFLTYLTSQNLPLPTGLPIPDKKANAMSPELMEVLLQGFLYDDREAYQCDEYQEKLIAELKGSGLIEKKKVSLTANAAVRKLLTSSKGKCRSIGKIVESEYQSLGEELRMLVLTDYIRKEYEKAIGDETADMTALGVLPFFEQIRRAMPGKLRLGVLCGTIVIIPAEAKEALIQAAGENQVNFAPIGCLPESDYLKVTAVGDSHFLTGAVTSVFTAGKIQVMIGTKSLLGEGWDSPCINSLILASFVGSFMLSNQMRGRAIRVFAENPEKTSNIWHLVCLPPKEASQSEAQTEAVSEDYALLERRMEHFLGLHYTEDIIENGIQRLSIIQPPFNQTNTERMNQQMLALSGKREELKARWMRSLSKARQIEIADETEVAVTGVPAAVFEKAKSRLLFSVAAVVGSLVVLPFSAGLGAVCLVASGGNLALHALPKYLANNSAPKRLRKLAGGICNAMKQCRFLENNKASVRLEENKGSLSVSLEGGTGRDQELFSQCVREFFAPADSQRYLLSMQKSTKGAPAYYSVPECFGKKKEDAQIFCEAVRPVIGDCELVYTRSESGRKTLMDARIKALDNREAVSASRKRVRTSGV